MHSKLDISKAPMQKQQEGSILFISLMLLVVVTMITFTASQSVLLQGKMTSSAKDGMLALQVAEAALLEAESNATSMTYSLDGGLNGMYDGECDFTDPECYMKDISDLDQDEAWDKSTQASSAVLCGNTDSDCFITGRYMIIKVGLIDMTLSGANTINAVTNQYQDQTEGAVEDVYLYKIIARGTGINPENKRVLISYYAASESE